MPLLRSVVAESLPGHCVAVLLKVYANCVDGEEPIMNGRIEAALGRGGGDGTL